MFDQVLAARQEKRFRSKTWLFAGSALAHAGLISGLVFWSFWQIDKLVGKGVPVMFVPTAAPPPPPPAAAPPSPAAAVKHKVVVARNDVVQPQAHPIDTPPQTVSGPPGGDPNASGSDPNGVPGGDPNGVPDGTGPRPDAGVAVKPEIVPESVIAAARIAGTREIGLPAAAKQALVAQGRHQTVAAVKLCLDTAGVPTRIDVVASTGFPEADQKLRDEIAAWRYRPYRVNGAAVPVCTAVTFRYQIDE